MSKLTILAEGQLGASGTNTITVVLSEPSDMPAAILVHWPAQSTVSDPRRFGEVAAAAMKVLAAAVTKYNRIKAARR